jgi:molybdopterin molybdotransferase
MVGCDQYVRPLLLKMQGATNIFREQTIAYSDQDIRKKAGRTEFLRAKVQWKEGKYRAVLTGPQGSGILTSMVQADGLIILDEGSDGVRAGDQVHINLFKD